MYGIFEVLVDTLLICTITGMAIVLTGTWTSGETGAALSERAFEAGLPGAWGGFVVTIGLVLFAFLTLIGWSYYGETAIVYLLDARAAVPYRLAWLVFMFLGAAGSLHLVGHCGHAQCTDGNSEPHLGADQHSADTPAAAGVLRSSSGVAIFSG